MKDKTSIIITIVLLFFSISYFIFLYKSGYDIFTSIMAFIPFLIFNYWDINFRLTDKERIEIDKKSTYLIKQKKSYLNFYYYFIYKKNNNGVYILMDIKENKTGLKTLQDAKYVIDSYHQEKNTLLEEHFYEPNNK